MMCKNHEPKGWGLDGMKRIGKDPGIFSDDSNFPLTLLSFPLICAFVLLFVVAIVGPYSKG